MFGASSGGGFSFGGAPSTPAGGGMFGAPAASSPATFGATPAPAPSPGLFGAAATPAATSGGGLFGVAATPAATSAPSLFGTAPGGFGASSAPSAFGATAPGFGAASSPASGSLFGAATPAATTGGLFGASASGAGFGAASTPSTFGASASAAGGLFGAAAPASGGLFGASAPAQTGGMFGAAPAFGAATGGGGLFGAAPGATGALGFGGTATGGSFGMSTPAAGGGLFGATPGISTQLAPASYSSHMPQPEKEVKAVYEAYNEADVKYKFKRLLYNVYNDPSQKVRPHDVDDVQWREALEEVGGPDNEQRLWPVMARGFKDLKQRLDAQDQALESDRQLMEFYTSQVAKMKRHHEAHTKEKVSELRGQHTSLKHRLLMLMRRLEMLDGAHQRHGLVPEEAAMMGRLHRIQQELSRPAQALSSRLEAVASAARLASIRGGRGPGAEVPVSVDDGSMESMHSVLKQQTDALRHLMEVLKRAGASLQIIEQESLVQRDGGRDGGGPVYR